MLVRRVTVNNSRDMKG